jgi:RNA polymerase sigma-70 factor (ECF subfamily)
MMRESLSIVPNSTHRPTTEGDRDLAQAAQGGDETAFASLVRQHSPGLHRAVARMLGDDTEAWDVVQMALVKAWQKLDRYDPKWSFATWLYRIGTNLAIDVIRARGSRQRAHDEGTAHHLRLVGDHAPTGDLVHQHDIEHVYRKVLQVLTPQQRAAFVLREIEGRDTAEVAETMGCTPTTVRNHVFQARKALRREIEVQFPEYLPAAQRS